MSRYLLAVAVLCACSVFALCRVEPNQPVPSQPQAPVAKAQPGVDPDMPRFLVCAKANDDCARLCEMCSAHCARLMNEGEKDHLLVLRLCQDCAAICHATSRVTAKDGPMTVAICTACADACKSCGDECAKYATDPIMKKCAAECRNCEKVCREMMKK